mmetsp:Transcript_11494/g.36334  ORF Transcript_11494/g.36334 Transcript_11494/m.36334 type:complete len:294 (+) Transcript_11494:80-961(+)
MFYASSCCSPASPSWPSLAAPKSRDTPMLALVVDRSRLVFEALLPPSACCASKNRLSSMFKSTYCPSPFPVEMIVLKSLFRPAETIAASALDTWLGAGWWRCVMRPHSKFSKFSILPARGSASPSSTGSTARLGRCACCGSPSPAEMSFREPLLRESLREGAACREEEEEEEEASPAGFTDICTSPHARREVKPSLRAPAGEGRLSTSARRPRASRKSTKRRVSQRRRDLYSSTTFIMLCRKSTRASSMLTWHASARPMNPRRSSISIHVPICTPMHPRLSTPAAGRRTDHAS